MQGVPVLVGNTTDLSSLTRIAESTIVLLSTAGPYHQSGSPVIEACIRAGTHYADITGQFLDAQLRACWHTALFSDSEQEEKTSETVVTEPCFASLSKLPICSNHSRDVPQFVSLLDFLLHVL